MPEPIILSYSISYPDINLFSLGEMGRISLLLNFLGYLLRNSGRQEAGALVLFTGLMFVKLSRVV